MTIPKNGFAFVIDTNRYAGNFEREMTAFLTGHIGDCGVGSEFPKPDVDESFFDNIKQVPDDNGTYRPTSCFELKNSNENNAVAIFFETKPSDEQISFMKDRVLKFDNAFKTIGGMAQFKKDEPEIKIIGFRLIEFNSTTI